MLTSMVVYSLLVLTVYGAALAQVGDKVQVLSFASGLLWALIVFTSLLGLNRSFVYSLLVLTVYGAALAQVGDKVQVLSFASGLLWALIVFTSLLGLNRSFSHETESGCLEGILLAPVDRAVVFLAKATSNLLFLLAVELVTVPLFFIFFLSGAVLPACRAPCCPLRRP